MVNPPILWRQTVAHADIRILQHAPHTLQRILSINYFSKILLNQEFIASNKKANRYNDPDVPTLNLHLSLRSL